MHLKMSVSILLNSGRFFFKLKQMIAKHSASRLTKLEIILFSISCSAKQHNLLTYFPIQRCSDVELDYTWWGWKMWEGVLFAMGSDDPPAPQRILEHISCNCKMGR